MVYVIIVVIKVTPSKNASLGDFLFLKAFINGGLKATMLPLTHMDPMKIVYLPLSFDIAD
jgi:hypothetical protein